MHLCALIALVLLDFSEHRSRISSRRVTLVARAIVNVTNSLRFPIRTMRRLFCVARTLATLTHHSVPEGSHENSTSGVVCSSTCLNCDVFLSIRF